MAEAICLWGDSLAWSSLPVEVGMRILAFLQVRDLVRISVVCKKWRSTILCSDHFHKLHSQLCPSQKCLLFLINYSDGLYIMGISFLDKSLFHAGRYKFLGGFNSGGHIYDHDRGLVCRGWKENDKDVVFQVGNPITNSWKSITSPSTGLLPKIFKVDSSNAYRILATRRLGSKITTEIFDSRKNAWKRGAILDLHGVHHSTLKGYIAMFEKGLIAAYHFEKDCWSLMKLDIPELQAEGLKMFKYTILQCKDKVILAALAQNRPHIQLWNGHACSGVMKWTLMAQLQGAALAPLVRSFNVMIDFMAWRPHIVSGCDDSIAITIRDGGDLFSVFILLEYNLLRHSWGPVEIPKEQLHLFDTAYGYDNKEEVFLFSPTLLSP